MDTERPVLSTMAWQYELSSWRNALLLGKRDGKKVEGWKEQRCGGGGHIPQTPADLLRWLAPDNYSPFCFELPGWADWAVLHCSVLISIVAHTHKQPLLSIEPRTRTNTYTHKHAWEEYEITSTPHQNSPQHNYPWIQRSLLKPFDQHCTYSSVEMWSSGLLGCLCSGESDPNSISSMKWAMS